MLKKYKTNKNLATNFGFMRHNKNITLYNKKYEIPQKGTTVIAREEMKESSQKRWPRAQKWAAQRWE